MRKGKKKLAQMMAAVLTATTLLQTPVSVFADPVVKEQVEKEASEGDSETTQEPEDEKEAEKNETSEDEIPRRMQAKIRIRVKMENEMPIQTIRRMNRKRIRRTAKKGMILTRRRPEKTLNRIRKRTLIR